MNDVYLKPQGHGKTIRSYVAGEYPKKKGENLGLNNRGDPIKNIILTGHSLGGGLAQVAHLFITAPVDDKDSEWYGFAKKDVNIQTVAFAAPMTTVLEKPSNKTTEFLAEYVTGQMRNFVYQLDVVPRAYANVTYIRDMLKAFGKETGIKIPGLKRFLNNIAEAKSTEVENYRHIGDIVYYEGQSEKPLIYVDGKYNKEGKDFNEIEYTEPEKGKTEPEKGKGIIDTALMQHSFLVNKSGLAYDWMSA